MQKFIYLNKEKNFWGRNKKLFSSLLKGFKQKKIVSESTPLINKHLNILYMKNDVKKSSTLVP